MKISVSVSVCVGWIDGGNTFSFPIDVYENNKHDLPKLILSELGVSESTYQRFIEASGHVICNGTTRSGKRCRCRARKNSMTMRFDDPAEWLAAQEIGGYCTFHGGE